MRNFFERQDEARQKTTRLVVLFGLAVVGIVVGTYLALVVALAWGGGSFDLVQPRLAVLVVLAVLLLVGGGSLFKVLALRDGGHVVAEALGGEKLDRTPETSAGRRVLNVVEEMAVAAGVPVPPVYILEEEGINAFAAGYTPDDAVVGVTRGCAELLDRAELQGVVAHEFSHILNQDMRLNIRLIGLLHGILLIGITGRVLMRSLYIGRRGRNGRGRLMMFVVGLGLVVVGSGGYFFGRLIKAAVSRQREFLADASAVQFTRNPDGIGGALKKIGGFEEGARVEADKAEEASHLFFGDALGRGLFSSGWLSTHPPLEERIKRIDPSFDGTFPLVSRETQRDGEGKAEGPEEGAAAASLQGGRSGQQSAPTERAGAETPSSPTATAVVEQAGTLSPEQVAYGGELRADVPDVLHRVVHEPLGAVAVAYGLLLDEDEAMRTRQLRMLRHQEVQTVAQETERLYPQVAALPARVRLPLLDLAAPALRALSVEQRARLHDTIRALAKVDGQRTLFEYALETIVRHRLEHVADPGEKRGAVRHFAAVKEHVEVLLSALASAGHDDAQQAEQAFRRAVDTLGDTYDVAGMAPTPVPAEALDAALDRLAGAAPLLKETVIAACARCALVDETVTEAEYTMLRAVVVALGVPMPPRVQRQDA